MKHLIITLSFLLVSVSYAQSQSVCTPSEDSAERTVRFFLTLKQSNLIKYRKDAGTENIPVSQIRHVDDTETCSKLNALTSANDNWQKDKKEVTRYYYRTNDFFFIFYQFKETRMEKITFVVVDNEFNVKGRYGI